jgi:sphingosine kinase
MRNNTQELAGTIDVDKYDTFATLSGDGLMFELLNGLMLRPDWQKALQRPLGFIPSGSGNGMSRVVEAPNVLAATLAVIKGKSLPLDLISYRQKTGELFYGFLMFAWGLVADIDIESEKYS